VQWRAQDEDKDKTLLKIEAWSTVWSTTHAQKCTEEREDEVG